MVVRRRRLDGSIIDLNALPWYDTNRHEEMDVGGCEDRTGMELEILGEIEGVETIASGRGVIVRRYLDRVYGSGRWRKMKGVATVRLPEGTLCRAEIYWFEAHGIGRKDFKIKRVIL